MSLTFTRAHFLLIGVVGVDPVTYVTWDSDLRFQTHAALLGLIHDELRYSSVGIKQSNKIFFVDLNFTKRIDGTMSLP